LSGTILDSRGWPEARSAEGESQDETNNPTLSAKYKKGANGPFFVFDGADWWTNQPGSTKLSGTILDSRRLARSAQRGG
jgi:hypothetical protein